MSNTDFRPIAERKFELQGPVERLVHARIGAPEPHPEHANVFRCPFQVTGLSNDAVKFASGVDSFQALNLAFAGIWRELQTNASVLSSFHEDFALTWEGSPWQAAIPVWVPLESEDEWRRLEAFKEELSKQRIAAKRVSGASDGG